MDDKRSGRLPDHAERQILGHLGSVGGCTAGHIAHQIGTVDARKDGALIRRRLVEMEVLGWVRRMDDQPPAAWLITQAGTDVINA